MKLRQINTKLTGIMILCHLAHYVLCVYMYLKVVYYPVAAKLLGIAANIPTIVHVILSIVLLLRHDSGLKISYPNLSKRVITQRASALFMLILLPVHINTFKFMGDVFTPLTSGQLVFKLVTTMVFFAAVFTHIALSISRACITFGDIRSEQAERTIDKISYITCAALFLLGCYAVSTVLMAWPRV